MICPDSWDRTIRNVIHLSKKDWKRIVQRRTQEKNHAPAKKLSALLEKMNHANFPSPFPVLPPNAFLMEPPLEILGAEWKVAG